VPRLQHVSTSIPPGAQETIRAFYGGVLGLEEKEVPQTLKHLNLVWFAVGEGEMELHFVPSTILAAEGDPRHFCLVVEDLEAYRKRLTEAGHKIIEDLPIPNRPRFFCRDPLGNRIELTTIQGDYRDAQ
jgi:catechol 2,3-dioxygenase-like lactoylglutathione lyase family enzyme